MIKIAFLGSDSTHTEAFARLINFDGSTFYDRARVVSIWGADVNETASKAAALRIPRIATTPDEAIKDADLAMVIGRFGESHIIPALTSIKKGIPTFIDKPFTSSVDEARAIIDASKKSNTPFFSSSPLRFARETKTLKEYIGKSADFKELFVSCPWNCIELGNDIRFENIFFYGIHVLEIALEILGINFQSYEFVKRKNFMTLFLYYEKYVGVVHMIRDVNEFYTVTAISTSERKEMTYTLDGSYYNNLLEFTLGDFLQKGVVIPPESSLQAVSILDEIERAKTV